MNYVKAIEAAIGSYRELELIDAAYLYQHKFNNIPKPTFYKILSRLSATGVLSRLTKGIYCIPQRTRFGTVFSSEKDVINYYVGNDNKQGVVIGYRMYNHYNLTTQIAKKVELYSYKSGEKEKRIGNVTVSRLGFKPDKQAIRLIQLLAVLENYQSIEDLNWNNFISFIKESVEFYDAKHLKKVLRSISYKKSTLASLKVCLDYFGIANSVDEYLNPTSKYKTISVEAFNELT